MPIACTGKHISTGVMCCVLKSSSQAMNSRYNRIRTRPKGKKVRYRKQCYEHTQSNNVLYVDVGKTSCISSIAGLIRLVCRGDKPNKKTLSLSLSLSLSLTHTHTHTHTHLIPHITIDWVYTTRVALKKRVSGIITVEIIFKWQAG